MNQRARLDPVPIPFIDVAAQRRRLGRSVDEAIARVLGHCQFILGPEVRALEAELAAFCGARHAVTCASGTDALVLALMAQGIGPGDAVVRGRGGGELQSRSRKPATRLRRRARAWPSPPGRDPGGPLRATRGPR